MLIRPEVGNMFKHSLEPSQLYDYRIANEMVSTKQHDEMWTPYQTNVFDQPQIHQSIWSYYQNFMRSYPWYDVCEEYSAIWEEHTYIN